MDSQHNIKRIRRGGGTRKEKKERKKEREKKKRKGENYKKKNRVESAALEQGVTELLGPEKEPEREREPSRGLPPISSREKTTECGNTFFRWWNARAPFNKFPTSEKKIPNINIKTPGYHFCCVFFIIVFVSNQVLPISSKSKQRRIFTESHAF